MVGAAFIILGAIFLVGGVLMRTGSVTGEATDIQSIFLILSGLFVGFLGVLLIRYRPRFRGRSKPMARQEIDPLILETGKARIAVFRGEIEKMVHENLQYVIFSSNGAKGEFVQFAPAGDGVLSDLPLEQLTAAEAERYEKMFPSNRGSRSYQLYFEKFEIQRAAETAEIIFREVYLLGQDYEIKDIAVGERITN